MKKKNIGGCVLSTQPDQQKRPQCKNAQKCKNYQTLKNFSSLVSLTQHFTNFIFLEQLTAMPQFNMLNILFYGVFFLSNHHDANPLLHLYHFRKKYNYKLANINSESSRVIFSFFFCLHLYNLCFGLSKLYTNIQQDQKAKLDYHMSILFAYMVGEEGG